jgi:hypothetical protein
MFSERDIACQLGGHDSRLTSETVMRILTSDAMIRFFCGFGVGCAFVFAAAHGLFSATL